VKAAKFDYTRPLDVGTALQALANGGGMSKPISGSQSLGPMLNLRLARPAQVVDIADLSDLRGVRAAGDWVEVGAAVTHAEIEDGLHGPLADHPIRGVASGIAYRAIRTHGTIGGSLAHADPAADWVVTLVALGAHFQLRSPRGERLVEADAFMLGAYTTVLQHDELIISIAVPSGARIVRWGYHKLCRKPGEFAEASAAVFFDVSGDAARIVLGAVDGAPILLKDLAAAVAANRTADRDQLHAAVGAALAGRDATDVKRFTVCVERALEQAGVAVRH
jgi:aerobic carbon-monoxide dehydrogenase medium subunit